MKVQQDVTKHNKDLSRKHSNEAMDDDKTRYESDVVGGSYHQYQ